MYDYFSDHEFPLKLQIEDRQKPLELQSSDAYFRVLHDPIPAPLSPCLYDTPSL